MPLDTRKMDAVIAHCDALGKRLDSLSKRRSDARQARKDAAERTFTKSQLAGAKEAVEKAKKAHSGAPEGMQRKARLKELEEAQTWLKKVEGSTITDSRSDATDRRQAVGRELELLKSHLTDMTEAHERERVEAKIADLEAESETLAAEPKADKGSKSK